MVNKDSKKTVKKENRVQGFCIFLSEMGINEEAKITNIAKKIGIHVNSVKDIIDSYETIMDAAKIEIIRGKDDKIIRIVRVKEENKDLAFKKEMRDGIMNINNRIDQIREDQKILIKKKSEKKTK